MHKQEYILTLRCRDDFGIVAAISSALSGMGAFIIESSQFGDAISKRFFMRLVFSLAHGPSEGQIKELLSPVIERFNMIARLRTKNYEPRTLLLVSKESHCLNNILYRAFSKNLPINIRAIVSNHETLKSMADWYQVPFFYIPIDQESPKAQAEQKLLKLIEDLHIDLVVLARYMQIFSPSLCENLKGKAINIHHSFLPSFKGARPYHQAFERGVKVVGATAHYVTPDLDEGPIIHQEIIRVTHDHGPDKLIAMGRDIESTVLSHAINLHAQERVLLNGHKTVVFA